MMTSFVQNDGEFEVAEATNVLACAQADPRRGLRPATHAQSQANPTGLHHARRHRRGAPDETKRF